eukprot:3185882-Pyramimonas_sp.AAC.1
MAMMTSEMVQESPRRLAQDSFQHAPSGSKTAPRRVRVSAPRGDFRGSTATGLIQGPPSVRSAKTLRNTWF